ncbi:cytochrome c [Sporosarcina sp. ANT_H38]|uniref:cytochrome c551 n=1 Tax=Sporosarcina sp. ANT_H38 TaxID=2597358 RepID=UPI0011F3D6DF|nr:cytochrome c [Sporosarcina sp. ANT_H38]KAA0966761.1 cytochrome c [Sporosarcina sp. ANT_H38]
MKNKFLVILLGALLVLVLGACGGDKTDKNANGDETTGTTAVDPEKIVQKSCVQCHGGNLEGQGTAPALDKVGGHLSETEIHDVIVNGRGGMPGGIIKGEEASAVAKWLAEKK